MPRVMFVRRLGMYTTRRDVRQQQGCTGRRFRVSIVRPRPRPWNRSLKRPRWVKGVPPGTYSTTTAYPEKFPVAVVCGCVWGGWVGGRFAINGRSDGAERKKLRRRTLWARGSFSWNGDEKEAVMNQRLLRTYTHMYARDVWKCRCAKRAAREGTYIRRSWWGWGWG